MEFNEKLQQLRTGKNLTQEQLAEQLYVSRTAISKWESGKGYPNIESLKCISKFFSVTIDELLSGEELITLAETENRSNLKKIYSFIYGILDMMAVTVERCFCRCMVTLLTDIFILSIYFHLQTLPQYILQSIGLFLLF